MSLSLESIRIVSAVVHEGGVNRAAKSLNKVPSAVTHAIQKLERNLNAKLFEKRGRSLEPTAACSMLIERGRLLMERASDLETSVRQVANGWDVALRIAISEVVPSAWILSIIEALYKKSPHTQISLSREVLAGAWDALISGRADIVVGAPFDAPTGRGLETEIMGAVEFIVAVAPHHPFVNQPDPLDNDTYRQYRAAVVPDTARTLPKLTLGVFDAQPRLMVPDYQAKREAQLQGLAVGALPRYMIEEDLNVGRLAHKPFAKPYLEQMQLAWRSENTGKTLQWLKEEILNTPADWLVKD